MIKPISCSNPVRFTGNENNFKGASNSVGETPLNEVRAGYANTVKAVENIQTQFTASPESGKVLDMKG